MDDIITKFGVELEICVRVGPDCIKHEGTEKLSNIDHRERFNMYFKYVLVPNARANPELIEKFPLICYNYVQMLPYIYDLRDPFEADNETVKVRDPDPDLGEPDLIKSYALPIFTDDPTVICGDATLWDSNHTNRIYNNTLKRHTELGDSIGFEMISPVLEISGEPTPGKISAVLHPLLMLFGLNKPNCFMSNYTSGFHVNISIYNADNSIINITKPPLIHHIMKEYLAYEYENYGVVRSRRPLGRPAYTSQWALPMQKRIELLRREQKRIEQQREAALTDTGSSLPEKIGYHNLFSTSFLKRKEGGLKIKNNEILEFRLFQSESDIELLEKYVSDAINIIHRGLASNELSAPINDNNNIKKKEYNNIIRNIVNQELPRMHGPDRAGVKESASEGGRRQNKTEARRRWKQRRTNRNGSQTIRIRNATRRRVK